MISVISLRDLLRTAITLLFFLVFIGFLSFSQEITSPTSVKVFPNPSQGIFTVESVIPFDQLETILITDLKGRVIHGYTLETSPTSMKVDFHHHPKGEYILHMIYKETSEHIRISKFDQL